MSKTISRYLSLLKKMHYIINTTSLDDNLRKEFEQIKPEYEKLVTTRGSIITEMIKIERQEESHYILEDADFSLYTIKKLIKEGQIDTEKIIL